MCNVHNAQHKVLFISAAFLTYFFTVMLYVCIILLKNMIKCFNGSYNKCNNFLENVNPQRLKRSQF